MSISIYYAVNNPLNSAFNALKIKSIYGTAHNFFFEDPRGYLLIINWEQIIYR